MKRTVLLSICLGVLVVTGSGFSKDIMKGVIRDAEGKPVAGVVVSIEKWGYETVTDREGRFVIPCVEGSLAIHCNSAHVPKWCWSKCRYRKTLTKDDCDRGWGEIRLRGILLMSKDGKKRWLFRSNTCEFVDNIDGTITDCQTGYMWTTMSPMDSMGITSCYTWDEAKTYCDALELAGHTDWELPSLAQLESIPRCVVHGGPISAVESWWSSSLTGKDAAWVLKRGVGSRQNRMGHHAVLAVRSVKE